MTGQDEREVPNMEYLTAWARREFGVSNGTQMWVEFQGSAEMLAKAVLDILPPQITPTAEVKAEALEEAAREVRPKEPTFDISDYSYGAIQVNALHYAADRLEAIATHLRENGGAR